MESAGCELRVTTLLVGDGEPVTMTEEAEGPAEAGEHEESATGDGSDLGDVEEMEEEILDELEKVHDPEIPVNIVDLGLIYETEIDDEGNVDIEMTLTSMGCPTADAIVREVELTAGQVEGVRDVDVELVWQPPWSPEKVSEEGKATLSAMGINV